MHLDDSFNKLVFFPVLPLPETATGVLCNCLLGRGGARGHGVGEVIVGTAAQPFRESPLLVSFWFYLERNVSCLEKPVVLGGLP